MAKEKVVICPYCGETQPAGDRCRRCAGMFDSLSRQATHNAMGPWFIRDAQRPFQPGCSYEMLVKMIDRGQVNKYSILRGPTTRQFWTVARRIAGIAHLLGHCHHCGADVEAADHGCHSCGVPFGAYLDRNYLGLPEVRPMPWEAEIDSNDPNTAPRIEPVPWGPRGRSLSSFATDDELFAEGGAHAPESAPVATPMVAMDATPASAPVMEAEPAPVAAPAPVAESAPNEFKASATRRAMQRRIESQQRLIRTLAVALGIAVLALILSNSSTIGAWFSSADDTPEATSDAAIIPADEATTPPASAVDRAIALIDGAENDGPIPARLADLDRALDILRALEAQIADAEDRTMLRVEIARAETLHLRLNVKQMMD